MTKINLIEDAGTKIVEFIDQHFDHHENGRVPASDLDIGDYNGSGAIMVKYGQVIPMTQAQYDDIVDFKGKATSRVAGEPHMETISLEVKVSDLGDQVAELIAQMSVKLHTSWSKKGSVITATSGERDKNACQYDLKKGYRFEQEPYTDDPEDSRYVVSLITNGMGTISILAANSGEIGRIEQSEIDGTDITSIAHTS